MSRTLLPTVIVGNEFVVPQPRLVPAAAMPMPASEPIAAPIVSQTVTTPVTTERDFAPPASASDTTYAHESAGRHLFETALDVLHHYSLAVFALLFLLVGSTGIQVGSAYWAAHILNGEKAVAATIKTPVRTIAGLNLTVPVNQLATELQTITGQPASITVGDQTKAISPDTIKSWLQITPSADKSQDYIRIKANAISSSLTTIADSYVKAPVNQVTSTSGGTPTVILAGSNGTALADPAGLKTQADAVAKTVMDGKGLQFNAPLVSQPFAAVTPAAFGKLIEVNVTTKQMYLYNNGALYMQYPISAGAPATPTPLGEFHIWEKLAVQTMKGFNPNGTPYVQPNVQWINYFDHSGDAVHGNYWRPLSYFGNINSSHGCVSLPNAQAEQVYGWTTIGTTVITHA
jgi:lipoprotein-anchoring transpeptidase ErfK/SrfK